MQPTTAGTQAREFLPGAGGLPAGVFQASATYTSKPSVAYYQRDGLGSVVGLAGSAGTGPAVAVPSGYDAWGTPSGLNDRDDTYGLPLAYTGLPYDTSAGGLTWAHARWYDASQGRMLSRDPLGGELAAPTSQNRYAYALDNPTTYSDPSGLSPAVQGPVQTSDLVACTSCVTPFDASKSQQIAASTAVNLTDVGLTLVAEAGVVAWGGGEIAGAIALLFGILGAEFAIVGQFFQGQANHPTNDAAYWNADNLNQLRLQAIAFLMTLFIIAIAAALIAFGAEQLGLGVWLVAFAFAQLVLMSIVQSVMHDEIAALPSGGGMSAGNVV